MKMKILSLHASKPMLGVSNLIVHAAILQIKKLGLRKKDRLCVNEDTARKWEWQWRELALAFCL